MSFISAKTGQFHYFDVQLGHPDWSGRRVLDFGGNVGRLLEEAGGRIRPSDYWCVEVSRAAAEAGRRRRPRAHWVYYGRYNPQFNPGGVHGLPLPDLGTRFDYVLAYSVFTHMPDGEAVELVRALRSMLADDGVLAFTFIDPAWTPPGSGQVPNVRWRLDSRSGEPGPGRPSAPGRQEEAIGRALKEPWCAVVGRTLCFDPDTPVPPGRPYDVMWSPDHARSLFPAAEVRPPAAPERQHCCLLGPTGRTPEHGRTALVTRPGRGG